MESTSIYATRDTGGEAFKVDLINDAYSMLRISGMTVDPTPQDLELALMRMESMMDEWLSRNVDIGYFFEDKPDPNTESGVIRAYWNAIASNLALRLTPDFNKQLHPILLGQARQAYSSMSGRVARERIDQIEYPRRQPRGSGSTRWFSRWYRFYRVEQPTVNASTTRRIFIGDVEDYAENFESFLRSGETIAAHYVVTDPSLNLLRNRNTDTDVSYRVEALNDGGLRENQQVTIVIDTSTGRRYTRTVLFKLVDRARGSVSGRNDLIDSGIPDLPAGFTVLPISNRTIDVGTSYTENLAGQFRFNGSPVTDLEYAAVSLPSWVSLSPAGTVTGTPTSADLGTTNFQIEACLPPDLAGGFQECLTSTWQVAVNAIAAQPVQWTSRQNWRYGNEDVPAANDQRILTLNAQLPSFDQAKLTMARTTPETLPTPTALGLYFLLSNTDESRIYVGWTLETGVDNPSDFDFLSRGIYAYIDAVNASTSLLYNSGLTTAGNQQQLPNNANFEGDELCIVLKQSGSSTTVELYRNGALTLSHTTTTRLDIRQLTAVQTYDDFNALVFTTTRVVSIIDTPAHPIPGVTQYTENDGV